MKQGIPNYPALDLDALFTYHAPTGDMPARYAAINEAARKLAEEIVRVCPPSPDTTHAVRVVRDARMWANASIACATPESLPPLDVNPERASNDR